MENLNGKMAVIKDGLDIVGGKLIRIEGAWEEVSGKSWMFSDGNPAAMAYAMRAGFTGLPVDDNVYYGHDEVGLGHLIHETEIESIAEG